MHITRALFLASPLKANPFSGLSSGTSTFANRSSLKSQNPLHNINITTWQCNTVHLYNTKYKYTSYDLSQLETSSLLFARSNIFYGPIPQVLLLGNIIALFARRDLLLSFVVRTTR